jgi:GntR family transcriptional regulator/MocR family aminotransferase
VRLPEGVDDGEVVRRAMTVGLAPTALSSLAIGHEASQGLMLGFTNVREEEATGLVERLVAVVGD